MQIGQGVGLVLQFSFDGQGLIPEIDALQWQVRVGVLDMLNDVLQLIAFFTTDTDLVTLDAALDFYF